MAEDLRAFLRVLRLGSGRIANKIGDRFRAHPWLWLLGIVLGGGFLKGLPRTTEIVALAVLGWLLLALILGVRPAAAPPKQEPAAEDPKKAEPEARTEPSPDDVATLLNGLLQDRGGVHLKALARVLPGGPWQTADVRALLGRHGVRVRAGVRVPGSSPLEGVHRDDVPPLPSPSPEGAPVGVVVPGQSNNNNAEKGYSILPDAEKRHRWHVIHRVRRDH